MWIPPRQFNFKKGFLTMKRPWAFICAAEGTSSAHLRRYCRTVFECGYVPVCPSCKRGQTGSLWRSTIPTSAIFTTILCVTSCCAAQCWWCAVATATRLSTHSSAWRKNTAEFVQPWMGSLRLRPEANRLSAELSTSSQPVNGFASIAFGYPNAHFGAVPQTPLRTDGGEQR